MFFFSEMQPSMLVRLLRKLTVDVSVLTEYTTVALRLLTMHFERCGKYYGAPGGQGAFGASSEEEKRLTMILFTNIFDSLAKMVRYFMLNDFTIHLNNFFTQNKVIPYQGIFFANTP